MRRLLLATTGLIALASPAVAGPTCVDAAHCGSPIVDFAWLHGSYLDAYVNSQIQAAYAKFQLALLAGYQLQPSTYPANEFYQSSDQVAETLTGALSPPSIQLDNITANDVVSMADPVYEAILPRGSGAATYNPGSSGGLFNGQPYFTSSATVTTYDTLIYPTAAGDLMFAAEGEPWYMTVVIDQIAKGATSLIQYEHTNTGTAFVEAFGASGVTDGALQIQQNGGTGAEYAAESSSAATALNTPQVLTIGSPDGKRLAIWRNGGTPTIVTGSAANGLGGFGTGAAINFEFMNNCHCSWAYIEAGAGFPDTELNSEAQRLATKYGISGVTAYTDAGGAALPTTDTPAVPVPTLAQQFANWINAAVFPTAADPVDQTAVPVGFGEPASDFQNTLSLVFTSDSASNPLYPASAIANLPAATVITSEQQADTHAEWNFINGQASEVNEGGGRSTGSYSAYDEVAVRTYPIGDIHDTHPVMPDGLHLQPYCANLQGTKCTGIVANSGNVTTQAIVSGLIRPETAIYPGDVLEVCYKDSSQPGAWLTNFLTDTWDGTAGGGAPAYLGTVGAAPYGGQHYNENDFPDGFSIHDLASGSSTAVTTLGAPPNNNLGNQLYNLAGGIPYEAAGSRDGGSGGRNGILQGAPYASPTLTYVAGASPYTFDYLPNGGDFQIDTSQPRNQPHCVQTELGKATYYDPTMIEVVPGGSGKTTDSIDGVIYAQYAAQWNPGLETGQTNAGTFPVVAGASGPAPSSLMVGLQYGPINDPNILAAMTPASVQQDYSVIYSIRLWHRVAGTRATPTLANAIPGTTAQGQTVSTPTPVTAGASPSGDSLAAASGTTGQLTFTATAAASATGSPAAIAWNVACATTSGGESTNVASSTVLAAQALPVVITGLTSGTPEFCKIQGYNGSYSAWSAEATGTPN